MNKTGGGTNLNQAESIEDNKKVFINRLIAAGWTRREAEQEWEDIQGEEESGQ